MKLCSYDVVINSGEWFAIDKIENKLMLCDLVRLDLFLVSFYIFEIKGYCQHHLFSSSKLCPRVNNDRKKLPSERKFPSLFKQPR